MCYLNKSCILLKLHFTQRNSSKIIKATNPHEGVKKAWE